MYNWKTVGSNPTSWTMSFLQRILDLGNKYIHFSIYNYIKFINTVKNTILLIDLHMQYMQ